MSDSTMAMLITTEVSAAPASRMRAARSLRSRPGSPRRSATLSGPGSVVTVGMLGRVLLNEASGGRGAGGGAREPHRPLQPVGGKRAILGDGGAGIPEGLGGLQGFVREAAVAHPRPA